MSGATIPEPASKKRGRPRMLSPATEQAFRRRHPETRSRRSLQNRFYAGRALEVLRANHMGRFGWMLGDGRQGVLVELGRIGVAQPIVLFATTLCAAASERELTTTAAAATVRRWRRKEIPRREAWLRALNAVYGGVAEMEREAL